jgi:hypothetical protein
MIQSIVFTSARANRLLRRRHPVLMEAFTPQSSLFHDHSRWPRFTVQHKDVPPNLPTPPVSLSTLIPTPPLV